MRLFSLNQVRGRNERPIELHYLVFAENQQELLNALVFSF